MWGYVLWVWKGIDRDTLGAVYYVMCFSRRIKNGARLVLSGTDGGRYLIAYLLCESYLATPIASVVKSKIQEKTKKYVTSGMIAADEFRVGSCTRRVDATRG